MKVVEGNYNEIEETIIQKVFINNCLKLISHLLKPELVSIKKNTIEVMSGSSEDNKFIKFEGTQKEIEELAIKSGWSRFISWDDTQIPVPRIGLQIKNKNDKTLHTVTGIDYSTIQICSRRGIINKISDIDLITNYTRLSE